MLPKLAKIPICTTNNETFNIEADDFEVICELGRGAFGVIETMKHTQTGKISAVKRITALCCVKTMKRWRSVR